MTTERQEGVDWAREIEFGRPIASFETIAKMGKTTVPAALQPLIEKARSESKTHINPEDIKGLKLY